MSHRGVEVIRPFLTEYRLSAGSLLDQRAAMEGMAASAEPPEGVSIRKSTLGGRQAEWISPDGTPEDDSDGAVVLYLHGGGYCIGSLDTHRGLAARIARATDCTVVTIDYRLAPEHRFPGAVEDACAAYQELLAAGRRPGRIAIAGDSAGGGLTIATLLALRSDRTPLPAAAVCLSPWVDLTQSAPTYQTLADADPMVSKEGLDVMAAAYLGDSDAHNQLASPIFADNLGDLPPVLIEVGEHEVLLDDSLRLAERIRSDGGSVSLTEWPELIHVFQAFPGPLVPEADESIAGVGSFLAGRLRTGP
jgi:acetyl esterase/lipase